MIFFPELAEEFLVSRLAPPSARPVRAVLDTDTYNEVDDQFALAYALLSPKALSLEAVYAAPFHNGRSFGPEDGMEKSYEEIQRVLDKLNIKRKGFVFKGSRQWMEGPSQPVDSPAARDIIARAMACKDDSPLYVLSIGAPTNVSSALLMEPELIRHIVVIWLGGQPLSWPTAREFNLQQDLYASQTLFDSGVPLVQIPTTNVSEHLRVTLPELDAFLSGKSPIGDYLCSIVHSYTNDPFGWSKVIWDISTVAWLVCPDWIDTTLEHCPLLTSEYTYSRDPHRHLFRVGHHLIRDAIIADMYKKLILKV